VHQRWTYRFLRHPARICLGYGSKASDGCACCGKACQLLHTVRETGIAVLGQFGQFSKFGRDRVGVGIWLGNGLLSGLGDSHGHFIGHRVAAIIGICPNFCGIRLRLIMAFFVRGHCTIGLVLWRSCLRPSTLGPSLLGFSLLGFGRLWFWRHGCCGIAGCLWCKRGDVGIEARQHLIEFGKDLVVLGCGNALECF
jgi:hypothetical protein